MVVEVGVKQSSDEGIRFPSVKAAERGGERLGQFSLQTLSDFKGVESSAQLDSESLTSQPY